MGIFFSEIEQSTRKHTSWKHAQRSLKLDLIQASKVRRIFVPEFLCGCSNALLAWYISPCWTHCHEFLTEPNVVKFAFWTTPIEHFSCKHRFVRRLGLSSCSLIPH